MSESPETGCQQSPYSNCLGYRHFQWRFPEPGRSHLQAPMNARLETVLSPRDTFDA